MARAVRGDTVVVTEQTAPHVMRPAHREGEMASTAVLAPSSSREIDAVHHVRRRLPGWAKVFVSGLALWVVTVVATFVTGNSNLVPTIILLGSFLVPVTFVVFALGRADELVTAERVFIAFVYGGVLGVLGASILEAALVRQGSGFAYVAVALIEEGAKLAVLWLLARHLPRYTARDGMVLGAAVGFGFAALESAGYAFNALFTSAGLSLPDVVETEVLRGILAPFGHGLWTAILGGALFATAARSRNGRPRLTRSLVGWYLLMAVLHLFWDVSDTIAVWITLFLTVTAPRLFSSAATTVATGTQVHVYTVVSWALLLLDAAIGVLILRARWHRAIDVPPMAPIATADRSL